MTPQYAQEIRDRLELGKSLFSASADEYMDGFVKEARAAAEDDPEWREQIHNRVLEVGNEIEREKVTFAGQLLISLLGRPEITQRVDLAKDALGDNDFLDPTRFARS